MNRRVAVPLIIVGGTLALTATLEVARRVGAKPTGAATGVGDVGCGAEALLLEQPSALFIAPTVGSGTGQAGPANPDQDVIAGRFVVRFAANLQVNDPAAWAEVAGLSLSVDRSLAPERGWGQPSLLTDTWMVRGSAELAEGLAALEGVELVEPLYRTRASGAPNDPYYGFQWNLSSLAVPDSWDTTRGRGVVIAVLDTGVSPGPDGLALLLDGYDFVDDDPDPSDSGWHGTHVAGVIAQVTDNGEGVASVAPGAAILPVRVLGEDGGNTADLAEGIIWAVDEGADVLNLSLGSSGESELVADALAYAEEQGVVVVAASGNDGYSDFVQFPASVETVLAVGATLLDESIAPYSNRGEELDLVAPAGTINHDTDGDGVPDGVLQEAWIDGDWSYVVAEGTSVATPHVSAVAALLIAVAELDPAAVRNAIVGSAIDLGSAGHDATYGHGLLDPVGALAAVLTDDGAPEDDGGTDEDFSSGGSGGVSPTEGVSVSLDQDDDGGTLGCGG